MANSWLLKRMLAITLIAVVSLAVGCAAVDTSRTQPAPGEAVAESPKLAPGDTWTWSTHTEKFLGEEAGLLVFQIPAGGYVAKRYRTKDLNLVKDLQGERLSQLRDPHAGFLSFPVFVGKAWSHSYKNRELSGDVIRHTSYRVRAYEQVTVKAGTFQAFRIEGTDQRSDRQYPIVVSLWYGPDAKAIVKFDGVDGSNSRPIGGWQFELLAYSHAR